MRKIFSFTILLSIIFSAYTCSSNEEKNPTDEISSSSLGEETSSSSLDEEISSSSVDGESSSSLAALPQKEGVYIGIVAFAGDAYNLTTGGAPIYLDSYGKNYLESVLNNEYIIAEQSGTALFYADHKALFNLKLYENQYPSNLTSVNLITFTDGLDNASGTMSSLYPIEEKSFTTDKYSEFIKESITLDKIGTKVIDAYSIGIRGSDVTDVAKFQSNLANIASTGKNYELTSFSEVQAKFSEIADGLSVAHKNTSFIMVTPFLSDGKRVRMTFDVSGKTAADAETSAKYIEGTIVFKDSRFTFSDIVYGGGLSAAENTGPINGIINGTEVNFLFSDVKGYDGCTMESQTKQWLKDQGDGTWAINSEYSAGGSTSTTVEKRSSIIYLVLDESRSLSVLQIGQIRDAVRAFINKLYEEINLEKPVDNSCSAVPSSSSLVVLSSLVGSSSSVMLLSSSSIVQSSSSSDVSSSSSFSLGAITGNLSFTNLDYTNAADSIFFIGTAPTISNTLAVGNATCVLDTVFGGNATRSIDGKFATAGTYSVAINVTCGTDYSGNLKTINATVAPNPTLNGTCEWQSDIANAFVGGTTAVLKGVAPTLSNNYGSCDPAYISKDGGTTSWESMTIPAYAPGTANTITNIGYYSRCVKGGKDTTITLPCPNIKIREQACEIETGNQLATFCPGISLDEVKLGNTTIGEKDTSICIYLTDMSLLQAGIYNGSAALPTIKINGENLTYASANVCAIGWGDEECSTLLTGKTKVDGGYYIYINSPKDTWANINSTAAAPNSLTCRE